MKKVPVFITNEGVLFPNSEYRFETTDDAVKQLLNEVDQEEEKQLVIIHSLDQSSEEDITQFPSVGVLSELMLKLLIPNSKMRAVMLGKCRVKVSHYEFRDGIYYAEIEEFMMAPIDVEREKMYSDMLLRTYETYVNTLATISNAMLNELFLIHDLPTLTDVIVTFLPLSIELKKKYLYELDPLKRARSLLAQLKEEIAIAKLEKEIDQTVHQQLDEEQKNYYLRQKMKVISEAVGDSRSKNVEVEKFKKRLKELKCNRSLKQRIQEEILRYETAHQNSPEITMMRDYIEWMLALPWSYHTRDVTSIKEIEQTLNETHYGMQDVKERIVEYIAVKQNSVKERSPILCLIGPPGVGKTSLAYSIAKSLRRRLATISVGGINDEAEIVGHRRTYIGALPGRIIQGLKKAGSSNPVFVIDEIDKMTRDIKGDPASSLLEILDKEQNHHFCDHYIEEPFDLSKVMFIATANYEEQIPTELRDRLEILHIPSYTEYEKVEIAEQHLLPRALEEHGLSSWQVQFERKALLTIVRYYTKEAGVRDFERLLSKILRKIVKKSLLGDSETFYTITSRNVEKYLGKKLYTYHDHQEAKLIGVVNGLAYTPFGGDILPIETTFYQGSGNLYLTGSLGEVMRESAQIALSYVKAHYQQFGIDSKLFHKDIHIHVPEGAIAKEGPSAGVSLTTSLISALSGQAVSTKLAMTGEITLQGRVLSIGGVREKVLGAYRAGIKQVFLPQDNKIDMKEIPKEIQKEMTFVFVATYEEIFQQVFSFTVEVV